MQGRKREELTQSGMIVICGCPGVLRGKAEGERGGGTGIQLNLKSVAAVFRGKGKQAFPFPQQRPQELFPPPPTQGVGGGSIGGPIHHGQSALPMMLRRTLLRTAPFRE